jgi:glutaredoxin
MEKQAKLYRMVTPKHICPFGIKSLYLLKRKNISVEDHQLTSREETETFQKMENVETTPQTFIDDMRVGGYDKLREYFGLKPEQQEGTSYAPVVMIFSVCFLVSLALVWRTENTIASFTVLEWFVAIAMCVLAIQKLRDVTAFTNQFITYDLLAMRLVPYAYVYPFAEAYAGIGMLAALPAMIVAPISLSIGCIGAISVIKAVYVDKRELKCACVGGNSSVPLGFVSLTENCFMIGAGIWMLLH